MYCTCRQALTHKDIYRWHLLHVFIGWSQHHLLCVMQHVTVSGHQKPWRAKTCYLSFVCLFLMSLSSSSPTTSRLILLNTCLIKESPQAMGLPAAITPVVMRDRLTIWFANSQSPRIFKGAMPDCLTWFHPHQNRGLSLSSCSTKTRDGNMTVILISCDFHQQRQRQFCYND